jgi:Spy/CpxP family protein refolding chaperone
MGALMTGWPLIEPHFCFNTQESATMKALLRGAVGLGLVALLAGPALAQGQGRGGFGMGGQGQISGLIANESVQKELKLDDTQTTKLKELAEKNSATRREKMAETKDLEKEERMTKMQEISKELNESTLKAVAEFLKPEQVTRLHQCSYQVRGAQAFADAEVAKKLNITDAQKGDIKTIMDESREAMMEIGRGFQDDREGTIKKIAEHNKETLAKVVAKLNDEQQKTWKELLGAPFEYTPTPFRPRNN